MVKITWFKGEVPKDLYVRQVYGIVFTNDGRLLLKVEDKKGRTDYNFPGGTPENYDTNFESTLRREFEEEVNTTLKKDFYILGYQLIENDGDLPPYAQMRVTALVDKIGESKPDPDNGKTYKRILTTPEKAKKLIGWGEICDMQIDEAVKVAKEKFGISEYYVYDEFV